MGCKALEAPALPNYGIRLRGNGKPSHFPDFAPIPLSHLFGDACHYRVSQVRQLSLTMAASVTFASWAYGLPSRLARVPSELDLMPPL